MSRMIRPSAEQIARRIGKPLKKPPPCPLLHEYEAVIHGRVVTVKRYGRPVYEATPLRADLQKRAPEALGFLDPDWI